MKPSFSELPGGSKVWWVNGLLHREDGPAVIYPNGNKEWFLNGFRHREDGPAIEQANGYKSWWLNGNEYTEEEYVMIQFMNGRNIYA